MKKKLLYILLFFGVSLSWENESITPSLSIGYNVLAQFGQYQKAISNSTVNLSTSNSCTPLVCENTEYRSHNGTCIEEIWVTDCSCNGNDHPDVKLSSHDDNCPANPNDKDDYGACTNRFDCPPFYQWDEYSCSCICSGGYQAYLRDCDGDGYFNPNIQPRAFCFGTEDPGWILFDLAIQNGEDCSDSCDPWDNSDQINGKKRHVRDRDNDGYYDVDIGIIYLCDDNNGYYILYDDSEKKGDCDDNNDNIRGKDDYVYDGDNDGWHDGSIGVKVKCPETNWILKSESSGVDCDDTTGAIKGEVKHLYDGDSDGFHDASIPAEVRCIVSSDKWIEETKSSGIDCDDSKNSVNVKIVYYRDKDCDGLGDPDDKKYFCPGTQDAGYIRDNTDEDDTPFWKKDGDGDFYTQTDERTGCKPGEDWIKSHRSLGDDCNDNDPLKTVIETWYYDGDGDGFYSDREESCGRLGLHWSKYADKGIDLNDNNVFVNDGITPEGSISFILPSLMDYLEESEVNGATETIRSYVSYNGEKYRHKTITYQNGTITEEIDHGFRLLYRNVSVRYEEILFGKVSAAARLTSTKLILSGRGAITNAQIDGELVENPPAGARTEQQEQQQTKSDWMKAREAENPSFSSRSDFMSTPLLNDVSYAGDPIVAISEASNLLGRSGLNVIINTYREKKGDGFYYIEDTPESSDSYGDAENPDLVINLLYDRAMQVEYVVSFRNEAFRASNAAIARASALENSFGWDDTSVLEEQYAKLDQDRLKMVETLSARYANFSMNVPPAPVADLSRFAMGPEDYPPYEVHDLSFIESILEFAAYAKVIITELKVPEDSWDNVNQASGYADWKVHSFGTLAGIYDEGIADVRDLAELARMAQSIFDEKFLDQILQSIADFNLADFAQSQLNNLAETEDKLTGLQGKPMQYYTSSLLAVKAIKTIINFASGIKYIFKPDYNKLDLEVNIVDNMDDALDFKLPKKLFDSDNYANLNRASKDKLMKDLAESDNNALTSAMKGKPELVDSWKVLDDASVPQALRSDPDKLTKVNRYLDNNPTKKDGFIDDLKNTSDPNKFVDRTSWKDDLAQQYGDDISQFSTQGLSRTDVPQTTVDDMLNSSSAPADIKQGIVDDLINSGNTTPVKVDIKTGDELFKISPKGDGVSDFSPYWTTKSELDNLRAAGNLEQKLGLPLGSHGVEYDVFKITATSDVSGFTSTIAPTLQNGYTTIGGATQTLVLDRTLWSTATKVETFIP